MHCGAYAKLIAGIVNYYDLAIVKMVEEHKTEIDGEMVSDFEVTLRKSAKDCVMACLDSG